MGTIGCSSDPTDAPASTSTTLAAPSSTTPASGTTQPPPVVVTTAVTELGTVLVDGDGFTLYVSLDDQPNLSLCTGSCAEAWPPLPGDQWSATGVGTLAVTPMARPDGTTQLAAATRPLYRFTGDTAAGEVNGQGVNGVWFVVDATGQPVTSAR